MFSHFTDVKWRYRMCRDRLSHWGPFFTVIIMFFWKSWLIHLYVTCHLGLGMLKIVTPKYMDISKGFDAISYCYPQLSVVHTTSTAETNIHLSLSHYNAKPSILFETASEDVSELRRWTLTWSSKATCTIFILLLPDSDVLHLCNKSSSQSKWLLKMGQMLLKTDSSVSFWCHPPKLWSSIQSRSSKIPVLHLIRRNSINRKPLRSSA